MPSVLSDHEFTLYASHMSLFLSDREASTDVDYSGWHDEAVNRRRVLVTPFELQISTARYDVVPVRLLILKTRPEPDATGSHTVECDLQVPSGKLVLHTVDDVFAEVPDIAVAPGHHRVRVTYQAQTEPPPSADLDEPGDHYLYMIELWPTTQAADPAILIQGPAVWAG